MVILHPMDDHFTSIWMLVIYIQQGRSWRMKLSRRRWRRRRRRRQAELVRRMLLLFMSAMFGRDEKRGATEAIHATFSRNAPKKNKGRSKKGSHGTQLLEGGELGALSTTLRQLQSATSGFALFRAEAYLGWAWLFPVCNRGEHLHVSKMGIASLRHV